MGSGTSSLHSPFRNVALKMIPAVPTAVKRKLLSIP